MPREGTDVQQTKAKKRKKEVSKIKTSPPLTPPSGEEGNELLDENQVTMPNTKTVETVQMDNLEVNSNAQSPITPPLSLEGGSQQTDRDEATTSDTKTPKNTAVMVDLDQINVETPLETQAGGESDGQTNEPEKAMDDKQSKAKNACDICFIFKGLAKKKFSLFWYGFLNCSEIEEI